MKEERRSKGEGEGCDLTLRGYRTTLKSVGCV